MNFRHCTAAVLTITRPFRNHLRHSLTCLRKSALKHDAAQSQWKMVEYNTALACYLAVQAHLGYGEEPAFFSAITQLLPVICWLSLLVVIIIGTLWARSIDDLSWRWRFSLASALLWTFLCVFLWSSFWWAHGKISIVHFLSLPILRTALFCNVRLSAERRTTSREKAPELPNDGESLMQCLGRSMPALAMWAGYLRWR